jgi:hypothetical protein
MWTFWFTVAIVLHPALTGAVPGLFNRLLGEERIARSAYSGNSFVDK